MRFVRATSIITLACLATATPHWPTRRGTGNAIPITRRPVLVNGDETVNFDALVASHVASFESKFPRGLNSFERNTGSKHPSAVNIHQNHGTGSPLIDAEDNGFWYGSISVGTPPRTFTVLVDTGSTDLFLPASDCHSNCSGHTRYYPASSSTAVDLGKTFNLNFGPEAVVTGEEYTDTISIAGFTATKQVFGAAVTYPSELQLSQFSPDGLMGLAFKSVSAYNSTSLFGTLVDQGHVKDAVFSVKLSEHGSELYIGGSNPALYTGNFTFTPVTQEGFWQVNMDNIVVNGKTFLRNTDVVIDTGTTLIAGPSAHVAALFSALGGKLLPGNQGGDLYSFPCSSFPRMSLTFGGKAFPIYESALNLGPISSGSPDCATGIIGMDLSHSFWIIGDVFLRSVYTRFDYHNLKVGFADLARTIEVPPKCSREM